MAIITLRIPDEVKQKYDKHSGPDGRGAMEKQLAKFQDVPVEERSVVLSPETRLRLEKIYTRPIEDQSKFSSWVEGLAALEIGTLHFSLTSGQLKRAQMIAHKQGRSLTVYLENTIKALVQDGLGGV